jgi:hypothetical protein
LEGRDGFDRIGEKIAENEYSARVELKSSAAFTGVVKNPSGTPLPDVELSDGAGKTVRTTKDGTFVLRSPSKWSGDQAYHLSFSKDGYLDHDMTLKSAPPEGLSIVLQSQPSLDGTVLDPDGRPVGSFVASAGAGLEPGPWKCTTTTVNNAGGSFRLPVRTDRDYAKEGKVWVAVKAPGFATWESTIDTWKGTRPLTVHLRRGVSLSGSVSSSTAEFGAISAKLLPMRIQEEKFTSETSQRQELGRREVTAERGGTFRFDHLAPGRYVLAISGPEISPVSTGVFVQDCDVDVGILSVSGRGSISGVAYEPEMICENGKCRLNPNRGVWAFAGGQI